MNLFGARGRGRSGPVQRGDPSAVVLKLDSALTSVFSEDGKRTVIYYLRTKFGLTLEQATADPASLERALTGMLGEVGWMVVKKAILEEFWDEKVGVDETRRIATASLREAFGFVHGLGFGSFLGP